MKEIDLLEDIRKGDLPSFEMLYETYYQPLCNFAYLYLNDREVTRDVVSDFFANLWKNRRRIKINQSIKSYLYRSTRNAVISHLRKRKVELTEFDEEMIHTSKSISPETILLKKEFREALEQVMMELPKKSGLVFRMKRVDGLSYREIAQVLDISEKTVENHITIAVKKLKEAVEKHPQLADYLCQAG
ncbi:MAG: RNA polymerase sigma-70 factor [Bacteroidota bacterium]